MSDATEGLERFLDAQDESGAYRRAVGELRAGSKTSHWIWFVFPQIAGLGRSPMAQRFAIRDLHEARAYLAHPSLRARLEECARALLGVTGRTAEQILGDIDAMKVKSSMTLFAAAAPEETVFREVLDRYYEGEEDAATLGKLSDARPLG